MLKSLALFAVLALAQGSMRLEWSSYKAEHAKRYSLKEDSFRFKIWAANKKMVEEHNAGYAAGEQTYWMALYEWSDWTQAEFEERMLGYIPSDDNIPTVEFEGEAPSSIDYRNEGKVTPVKNQGQCGSCWAFSSTGCMEGMWMEKRGELISMSEQQMIDCGEGGCNGGYMTNAWETVKDGIESESTYPYTARDGSCHANSNNFVASNSGSRKVSHSESALEEAVASTGYPVSVAVAVGSSFQHYSGGIFSDPSCQYNQLNHAVLCVGYQHGSHFIVKNSWGGSWGESGYILMKQGENSCGIANDPMYAILN